ncbi:hypothetical protein Tco_1216421 [Tanacetum coccineum]
MARMDAMTMKMDAQCKEFKSRSNKPNSDHNDDGIPMSREEEAKFMQTFRRNRFYNDYRDHDSNRARKLDIKGVRVWRWFRLVWSYKEVMRSLGGQVGDARVMEVLVRMVSVTKSADMTLPYGMLLTRLFEHVHVTHPHAFSDDLYLVDHVMIPLSERRVFRIMPIGKRPHLPILTPS